MDLSKALKGLPKSHLSVNEMISLTEQPFFQKSIGERTKDLGGIRYVGFKYTFHRDTDSKLVTYVNLYFYMKGSNSDGIKNGKKVKKKRENYMLVAKFPYTLKIKNMKRLYDLPIQIFSSDPSFKYFFAYALNRLNAVVTDDSVLVKHLGKSLTTKPKKTNPDLQVQLTKHFYNFFKFIANRRPKEYLDRKYMIPSTTKVKVLNGN